MRERILNEIKRLAELDGGKAPGQGRFEKQTGIRSAVWRGKLWTKWSDAIVEAGFAPNALNAPLDSSQVLDDYAEACRHYGRPPTHAELNLYGRERPEFMGVNTYRKHFGSKDGIVAALRKRAVEHREDDLIAILPEIETSVHAEAGTVTSQVVDGSVYLLKSGHHFKIGRSEDLEKRVKQISIALPQKVELVHAIRTDDPSGIEGYWHRRFADRRANGEWFELSPADVKAFKRRKFQ